ncbi:PepSY domain-containing protein [Xanthobacter autotrophicus DSM 431]|uniref:PepSY domain-containing protein n=1 Tax=Xanthobacter nonsaccharivorans TaxID=3119912 RepID=UPI003727C424
MLHLSARRAAGERKVKRTWFAGCLLVACIAAGPAAADSDCNVPLADWQPREVLQKKLEAEGWTVLSIRSDDGCYKVLATNTQGGRLKAKYDPASLERIRHGRDGRDDD